MFVSDLFGVSGRAMLAALIAGERDLRVLAGFAQARMRSKMPVLAEALTGRFSDHHAFLCRMMLDRIDEIDAAISAVTERIKAQIAPLQAIADRLDEIPGVNQRVTQAVIAEIGADMPRFPTGGHLASWAGMCPGNNESAGRHFSGRTRKGDVWLRAALGEATAAASRANGTYLQAQYRRLAAWRGKKRVLVAVGHSILITIWQMISNDDHYHDLGAAHFTRLGDPAWRARRLVGQLHDLGYQVQLDPIRAG